MNKELSREILLDFYCPRKVTIQEDFHNLKCFSTIHHLSLLMNDSFVLKLDVKKAHFSLIETNSIILILLQYLNVMYFSHFFQVNLQPYHMNFDFRICFNIKASNFDCFHLRIIFIEAIDFMVAVKLLENFLIDLQSHLELHFVIILNFLEK